ncbi:MAG: inorganic phosphate transporter, partial [Gemmatimonadota bacterium]
MNSEVLYVLVIILVALAFDFINGFHDSANSIATVVSTRVLTPGMAVAWAAFFNFVAAFVVGTAVAKTISKGLIDPSIVDSNVLMAALLGAIAWNLVTWFLGLPSSSSHALMGGFGGAAVAKAGVGALIISGWVKPILAIAISPLLGAVLALLLTVSIGWGFRNVAGATMEKAFRRLQLISAGLFSLSHGANDAQKTMGIIVGLLVATQHLFKGATGWQAHLYLPSADHVPFWIIISAHAAIAAGTAFGGWRIVKTMGTRITRLRPFGGFCAETGGASSILVATALGVPVSTTHTITGAIVGVGA